MNLPATLDLSEVIKTVEAAGLMRHLCTIKTPPPNRDAVGRRSADPADWEVLPGHENIPCIASPAIIPRVTDSKEQKLTQAIGEKSELHVLLNDFYPTIRQSYRATLSYTVEAGTFTGDFDILGVEWDSQHTMTRLAVQVFEI